MALLMLSYASVQSQLMRMTASATAAPPMCGGPADPAMASMQEMAGPAKAAAGTSSKSHAPARSCPYCAAAAHPPLIGTATPWRTPSTFTFTAFRVVASQGPRGPPACQPRARGPPADPLSL